MADSYDSERIRRGIAVLVDDAPVAPEFDELTMTEARPIEPRKSRPVLVTMLSAATVVAVFAVGAIWQGQGATTPEVVADSPSEPDEPPPTLADLAPGEFPRVSLDAPGWSIVYIDHTEGVNDDGEFQDSDVFYSNQSGDFNELLISGEPVELRMSSGSLAGLENLIADRADDASRLTDQPIWDTAAAVVDIGGGYTAMWESNSVVYEFVVYELGIEETFRSLLASLIQTDEETWTASLSDEIVTDRSEVLPTYLAEIPLPPGFDTTSLEDGPVEHWYPVAADTVSAISCAWIETWIDARANGDRRMEQQAVDAMASAHEWKILTEMEVVGEFPSVVLEYADAMADDGTIVAGVVTSVEDSYRRAFGCQG